MNKTSPNETLDMVTRSMSKRKHSDYVDDNENTKRQKVDGQNEQVKENIKLDNVGTFWQSENDVSTKNKEEIVKPTHSELNESNIAHFKDDDALSLDEKIEWKSNSKAKINNDEESKDFDNYRVSENEGSQHEQSEIAFETEKTVYISIHTVCKTASESDTSSQSSDESSTTEVENVNSGTSAVPDPEPIKREEAKKFRNLYRLLREGENKNNGLKAKNPSSCIKVAEHVANGSNGGDSKYISTSATLSAAQSFLDLKRRSTYKYGTKEIVKIDVNNLPSEVSIIDLTDVTLREQYEVGNGVINSNFHNYAERFMEVLLVGDIPADCIQYA